MITTLATSIDFSNFIFSLLHFMIIIWAQLKESFISNKNKNNKLERERQVPLPQAHGEEHTC